VHEQQTRDMLGTVDQAYLYPLLEALTEADGARLMREAEAIAERSLSFDAALQDLALLLQQIALAQTVPSALAEDVPERARLFSLAERIDPETVQLYYQITTLGRRDMELAPDEYAGFSMTLLRMLAFAPAGEIRPTTAKPASTEMTATPAPQRAISENPVPPVREENAVFNGDWFALSRRLSGGVKQLAALCELSEYESNFLKLRLPGDKKSLLDGLGEKLRLALRDLLGPATRVEFELGITSGTAPAEIVAQHKALRQAEAEAAIMDDPFVQTLVRDFDATVTNIKPIGEQAL
jgi:DNA polymerase-3 subunit gamma/tau